MQKLIRLMLSQSRTQRGSHFGGLQLISSAELISLQWGGLLQVSFLFFAMSFSLHFSRGSYYATSLSFGSLHLNFYQSSKLFHFHGCSFLSVQFSVHVSLFISWSSHCGAFLQLLLSFSLFQVFLFQNFQLPFFFPVLNSFSFAMVYQVRM